MTDALTRSMVILELGSYSRSGSSDRLVRAPPGPEPLLVLCGDLNAGSGDIDQLLPRLKWAGGNASWVKAPPLPPEHPYSNTG